MRLDLFSRVQSLMSTTPWRNLRHYIMEASLPHMELGPDAPVLPPPGHQSHLNTLSVVPANYRKLYQMHVLYDEPLLDKVDQFLSMHLPSTAIEQVQEGRFKHQQITVPSLPRYVTPHVSVPYPDDIQEVSRWVRGYPLETVECILHRLFPSSQQFTFVEDSTDDLDRELMACFTWRSKPPHNQATAVVFVQPPWILSPRDLELFISCKSLPMNRPGEGLTAEYGAKERLWAKIWDECFRRQCPWFVITTYWGWAFGSFSRAWSVGFVSGVFSANVKQPAILGCILYWIASAMGEEGGWTIPEVPEPVDLYGLEIRCLMPRAPRMPMPIEPSESEWENKADMDVGVWENDSQPEEAFEVRDMLMDVDEPDNLSLPSHNSAAPPVRNKEEIERSIKQWQVMVTMSKLDGPGVAFNREPSPANSNNSNESGVIDFSDDHVGTGEWLAVSTLEQRFDFA